MTNADDPGRQPESKDKPGAILLNVLPLRLVQALAVLTFVLALLSLAVGIFLPGWVAHPTARVYLCVAVALCLGIFVFILYPQEVKLSTIPLVNLAVPVAGPLAVFVILLNLLLTIVPGEPVWLFFETPTDPATGRVMNISASTVTITSKDAFRWVALPNEDGSLAGFFIRFPPNYPAEVTGTLNRGFGFSPAQVRFERGGETFQVTQAEAADLNKAAGKE